MKITEKDFFTVQEFANVLNIHYNTVRKMIKNGRVSAFRIGIGIKASYRIPASETHRMALVNLEDIVDQMVEKRIKEKK